MLPRARLLARSRQAAQQWLGVRVNRQMWRQCARTFATHNQLPDEYSSNAPARKLNDISPLYGIAQRYANPRGKRYYNEKEEYPDELPHMYIRYFHARPNQPIYVDIPVWKIIAILYLVMSGIAVLRAWNHAKERRMPVWYRWLFDPDFGYADDKGGRNAYFKHHTLDYEENIRPVMREYEWWDPFHHHSNRALWMYEENALYADYCNSVYDKVVNEAIEEYEELVKLD